jgi:hypothetical protein
MFRGCVAIPAMWLRRYHIDQPSGSRPTSSRPENPFDFDFELILAPSHHDVTRVQRGNPPRFISTAKSANKKWGAILHAHRRRRDNLSAASTGRRHAEMFTASQVERNARADRREQLSRDAPIAEI